MILCHYMMILCYYMMILCHHIQFLKRSTFAHRAFTMHSRCLQRAFIVHSQFSVQGALVFTIHKAFNVPSPCVQLPFTKRSSFPHHLQSLQPFSFGTPTWNNIHFNHLKHQYYFFTNLGIHSF